MLQTGERTLMRKIEHGSFKMQEVAEIKFPGINITSKGILEATIVESQGEEIKTIAAKSQTPKSNVVESRSKDSPS